MQVKLQRCTYCLHKILDAHITCKDCANVKLCINCFSSGAESGCHLNSHRYAIESDKYYRTFGIFEFENNWSFKDELMFIEAVETYGYGNWNTVASKLNGHSAADCKQHFENCYLNGPLKVVSTRRTAYNSDRISDHTLPVRLFNSSKYARELRSDICSILGYMPYRDEFEIEYHNDAERTIACVPIGCFDDLEIDLHLALVDIYNRHLSKRQMCHVIAREHGVLMIVSSKLASTLKRPRPLVLHKYRSSSRSSRGRCKPWSLSYYRRRNRKASKAVSKFVNSNMDMSSRAALCNSDVSSNVNPLMSSVTHDKTFASLMVPESYNRNKTCQVNRCNLSSSTASMPICRVPQHPCSVVASNSTPDSGIGNSDFRVSSSISNGGSGCGSSAPSDTSVNLKTNPVLSGRLRSKSDSFLLDAALTHQLSVRLVDLYKADIRAPEVAPKIESNDSTSGSIFTARNQCVSVPRKRKRISNQPLSVRNRDKGSQPTLKYHANSQHNRNSLLEHPEWLKPFLRFLSPEEASRFVTNCARESELKSELHVLMGHHERGVRSMQDIQLPTKQFSSAKIPRSFKPANKLATKRPYHRVKLYARRGRPARSSRVR